MSKIWSKLQCCLMTSIPLKSTFVQVAESPPTSLDSKFKYNLKCNAIYSNLKRTAARKSLQIQFPAIQAQNFSHSGSPQNFSHPGSPQFSHSGSFLFSLYSEISYLFQFYFFAIKPIKNKNYKFIFSIW